mmetsp:Transcript_70128/g.196274  ORF Transcript_70128/g.196274 Transcript_70128/m.196274 type:complete len:240 (+) Transcript_70128:824-1543(+)
MHSSFLPNAFFDDQVILRISALTLIIRGTSLPLEVIFIIGKPVVLTVSLNILRNICSFSSSSVGSVGWVGSGGPLGASSALGAGAAGAGGGALAGVFGVASSANGAGGFTAAGAAAAAAGAAAAAPVGASAAPGPSCSLTFLSAALMVSALIRAGPALALRATERPTLLCRRATDNPAAPCPICAPVLTSVARLSVDCCLQSLNSAMVCSDVSSSDDSSSSELYVSSSPIPPRLAFEAL